MATSATMIPTSVLAAATSPSTFDLVSQAIAESVIGPFAQELLVLTVFISSYSIWKLLTQRRLASRRHAAKLKNVSSPAGAASAAASPKGAFGAAFASAGYGAGARAVGAGVRRRPSPTGQGLQALEKQMMKHLEHHEFTRALNLYRSLEREGQELLGFSEELYASFVQSAIRVGKVDVVDRMLRAMKRQGLAPSLAFWQSLLKMLSSRKHFSACLSIHSHFSRQLPLDKVVFSCFINAALEVGDPQRAAQMLDKYRECHLDPKDYVLFFRTYHALGDADSAEASVRELGASASTLMLNLALLTCCVAAKQPDRGLGLLREAHDIERSSERQERLVDTVSYNTVIKGFAQAGRLQQCFEAMKEMSGRSVQPDDVTWGTLLDACICDNQLEAAGKVVDMVMADSRPLEVNTCTTFIKGLVRANCVYKALELCDMLRQRHNTHPDIITYSFLIKALVEQRDLERAMGLVSDLRAAGLVPDDIVMTHLLEGCRHAGNHELGKQLFEQMLEDGVKPSEFALISMLKLHGRCAAHSDAYEMVKGWEKTHGTKPSVIHYTCLMSGCIRTKSFSQAWDAYELMVQSGVEPDATMLSTLLPGMVSAQRWDAVLELARKATSSGRSSIPVEHLSCAVTQMQAVGGQQKYVDQLRDCLRAAGVSITARQGGGARELRR